MSAKKSTKTGENFRGGGLNFSGWPEYIPLISFLFVKGENIFSEERKGLTELNVET